MKKRWTSLFIFVLIFSVSFHIISASAQNKFPDLGKTPWATKEINYLTDKGIINGYPNGKFGPEDSITRLQAVTMILRQKGIKDFSNIVDPGFSDMNASTYGYEVVAKGVELGFINGKPSKKGNNFFDPSGTLTRAEMAKILVNAYDLKGTSKQTFTDVKSNHWAYSMIQTLVKNQITNGLGNGKFGHSDNMTRAQFAVMMARVLDESFRPALPLNTTYLPAEQAHVLLSQAEGWERVFNSYDYTFSKGFGSDVHVDVGPEHVERITVGGNTYYPWYYAYVKMPYESAVEMLIEADFTREEAEKEIYLIGQEMKKIETLIRAAADATYGKNTPKANALYNEILHAIRGGNKYVAFARDFE